jgi:hypothetical protein
MHDAATGAGFDLSFIVFLQLVDGALDGAGQDVSPAVTLHFRLIAALAWDLFVAGLEVDVASVMGAGSVGEDGLVVDTVEVGVGLFHVVELLVDGS